MNVRELCKEGKYDEALQMLNASLPEESANDTLILNRIESIKHDLSTNKEERLILSDILSVNSLIESKQLNRADQVRNFTLSILAYSIIPLMPFIANYLKNEFLERQEVIPTLALYSVSISLSLNKSTERLIGLILSIFSFMLATDNEDDYGLMFTVSIAIVISSLFLMDRVQRHIFKNERFL